MDDKSGTIEMFDSNQTIIEKLENEIEQWKNNSNKLYDKSIKLQSDLDNQKKEYERKINNFRVENNYLKNENKRLNKENSLLYSQLQMSGESLQRSSVHSISDDYALPERSKLARYQVKKDHQTAPKTQNVSVSITLDSELLNTFNGIAADYKTDRQSMKLRREFYKRFELYSCGNASELITNNNAAVKFISEDGYVTADYLLQRNGGGYVLLPVPKEVYEQSWYIAMKNLFDIEGGQGRSYHKLKLLSPAILSDGKKLTQRGRIAVMG